MKIKDYWSKQRSLFDLKRMTSESAIELEQLYSSITQIYRSLETLQRPVSSWDDILVFIAVRCLDVESVKIRNHHLGSSRKPATWNQFSEFLITRLRSLQAFEKCKPGKSTVLANSSKIRVHYQGTSNLTSSSKEYSCVICMSNHYIAACPQYNSKSVQQRLALINKHKLCYNCLESHKIS